MNAKPLRPWELRRLLRGEPLRRYLYLRDLPASQPARRNADGSYTEARRPLLLCPSCGGEYSADRGDYFWMPATTPFRCGGCRAHLQLVTKHTVYRKVGRA